MSSKSKDKEVKQDLAKILFVCVNRELHISYLQQKHLILSAMNANPHFNNIGQIWQTLEKGVNYPVIHYLPLNDSNNSAMNGIIGKEFKSFQVLYKEIERIELPVIASNCDYTSSLTTDGINGSSCAHIFLGYKVVDKAFNVVLEENWKVWTGARNLYLNLSTDFGLSKIRLFKRIEPNNLNDLNAFMYILIADCTHINDKNRIFLLDFVDRFRLQTLCGYLTVYTNISNDNMSESSFTSNSSDSGNSSDSRNLINDRISDSTVQQL